MTAKTTMNLKDHIRSIPDFPKKGILFRDITTLLNHPEAYRSAIDALRERVQKLGATKVAGIESRGFLTAAPLAYLLGVGFIPIRKKGKLPYKSISVSYELEYGTDALEIHVDALGKDDKVLIADDLLATGGTSKASASLIEKAGASVAGLGFLIELKDLNGREKLQDYKIESLISY